MAIEVSIIIPCFNEEEALPTLISKLSELVENCKQKYNLTFIFVDDGSTDKTYSFLKDNDFSKNHTVIKHDVNQNLGAAIKTGLKNLKTCTYAAFLDSDCTYDPKLIIELLELLEQGADMSTVSPYHPSGKVEGVPAWRLLLSSGLSNIYRLLLGLNLYTYTAMVRAHKYSIIKTIVSNRDDFTFFTDSLMIAASRNLKIVELPAVLSQRKFGVSKMRTLNTIFSHLGLIFNHLKSRIIK